MGYGGGFNGVIEGAVLKVLKVGRHNGQDRIGVGQGHKAHNLLEIVLQRAKARIVLVEIPLLGSVLKANLVILPIPHSPSDVYGLMEIRHRDRLVDVLPIIELVREFVGGFLPKQLFGEGIVIGVDPKPHLHLHARLIGRVEIGDIELVRLFLNLVLLVLRYDFV